MLLLQDFRVMVYRAYTFWGWVKVTSCTHVASALFCAQGDGLLFLETPQSTRY